MKYNMGLDTSKQKQSLELYKKSIEKIEYEHLNGDPYWGDYEEFEIRSKYNKLVHLINEDNVLSESHKKELLDIIKAKISKMPEIEKKRKEKRKVHKEAEKSARERYDKLTALKKMKHKIMKQDPKNLIFDVMSVERINDLYSSKKRK